MSGCGYRNKLLVKLSQNNVQHYNSSSSTTMASELNHILTEKENITGSNTERPSMNTSYEYNSVDKCSSYVFDSRNISPLIPLTEAQINECIADNLGDDVNYAELLPVPSSTTPVINIDTISSCTSIVECPDTSSAQPDNRTPEKSHSPPVKKVKRSRDPKIMLENQKKKHPMRPSCQNCKKNCSVNISETDREIIYNQFWSMDRQRRRDFLSRQVHKMSTASKTAGPKSRRHNTLIYNLNEFKTCKTFFLNTLGFSNDEAVQAVLKQNHLTQNMNPKICAAPDPRGRHAPSNAFPAEYEDEMKKNILKYNPMPSHYNIKHAPNRRYLPVGVNFSGMYKEFKLYCLENNLKVCSWAHFYSMIKQLNLSTAEPAQDICTKCKNHELKHKILPLPCNCEDCIDLGKHLQNKRDSRRDLKAIEEMCENSEGKDVLYTVDMQKAICMPLLTTKEYFFSRKLVLFNESFVPPGKNKQAVCAVWHEGESGRKAHNVASTYTHFLRKYCRDCKSVTFFLDNCNAQNKNKILLSALVRVINDKITNIDRITLEYFEPGHTFMAADAVHAAITKKLKSKGTVYDIDDFICNIQNARKNMQIDLLLHDDMILFKNDSKVVYPKGYNIHNLKIIEFRRSELSIFVKNDYNAEFKEIVFLKRKIEIALREQIAKGVTDLLADISKETEPRGISEVKKKELLELCKSMPQTRRIFYENLVVSESPDLDERIDNDLDNQ